MHTQYMIYFYVLTEDLRRSSYSTRDTRPQSSMARRSISDANETYPAPRTSKKKKFMKQPSPPKPAFQTSTGEKIHSAWDLDDDDELL